MKTYTLTEEDLKKIIERAVSIIEKRIGKIHPLLGLSDAVRDSLRFQINKRSEVKEVEDPILFR